MKVSLIAFALTLSAFLCHWILWRIHVPKRQTAALLTIFSLVLLCGWAACSLDSVKDAGWGLDGPWQYLHVGIFHTAMMLGYVVAYSAIEEKSPSMTILSWVAKAGPDGRTRDQVEMLVLGKSPIENRLQAMLRDRMVELREGHYVLTAKGQNWAAVFRWWASLINAESGG
ncbi:MAG: hypothetical protein EBT03_10075 [Betaproteobacteria bacterium]|nr:hypothetical protein [Betaproteobacteria bacterium]NCA17402.1 hypothetical protein [Betaproteobacteria bacterium]